MGMAESTADPALDVESLRGFSRISRRAFYVFAILFCACTFGGQKILLFLKRFKGGMIWLL
jgi:hypothetical protein